MLGDEYELAQCARDISIATFASEAASDDDDFLYGKRWKKAVKARKGKLLEKTVRTFGAPKEKRGEIWYELSGARQFADMAKESYERLVERAEEEDGREMLSASKASSSSFRGGSKQKKKNGRKTTKSDEDDDDDDDDDDEDDDTTYNVHRDGSERSKSEKKRERGVGDANRFRSSIERFPRMTFSDAREGGAEKNFKSVFQEESKNWVLPGDELYRRVHMAGGKEFRFVQRE